MTVPKQDLISLDRRISETLDVVHCRLKLVVDKSYKRAKYELEYCVRKRSSANYKGEDKWFGVIAYATNQIENFACTKSTGALSTLHSLEDGRTVMMIPLGKELLEGEEYSFSYSYKTRIESIVEKRMFRTAGNASYYIAHVSPCYHLEIKMRFENSRTRILKLHPNGELEDSEIVFGKLNVSPMEFYVFNCLYETGLPRKTAYVLEQLIWIIVGIVLTFVAEYIIA